MLCSQANQLGKSDTLTQEYHVCAAHKFQRQHFCIVYLKYITSVIACTQLLMVTVDVR